ncbi:MAG: NfeD family protein [Proteobacteria bacterium]|nr:NfeD family protein [Pseudomonadota bacterium]
MADSFNGLEMFFIACAVIGGFFVLIRLVLQFAGGGTDGDMGVDGHGSVDAHHADSDLGFKFLSIHGLSTFLMMFGLMGLALYRQSQVGAFFALGGASVAGIAAVWVIGKLFQGAARLQSSGTLETKDAVGSTGTVYLTIPEKGVGRVNISFLGRLREFDAMEINGDVLATGSPVRVVKVNSSILVVEKI